MNFLKIGNIKLKNRLFLAPMVDVTDLAFRMLCRQNGAAIGYTEMLYIDAVLHENRRTLNLMKTAPEDKPVGLQVTGNNLDEFRRFSKLDVLKDYDLIDINCGCPSSKIVGSEAGSYLLKTPDKIGEMIKILKNEGYTVTAKIRLGFDNNNVMAVSKRIEQSGGDLLTLHAILVSQKPSESADWSWISKVKDNIGIPVVGNGGVVDGRTAREMLEIADGAMVAGAAIGNPLIFRQILHYIKTGRVEEITGGERTQAFRDYLKFAKYYGVVDLPRVKYLGANLLTDFDGESKARVEIMKLKSFEDIDDFTKNFINSKQ